MFTGLKNIFKDIAADESEVAEENLHLACAVLLIEVAKADHQLDVEELESVTQQLAKAWKLDETTLGDLMLVARTSSDENASLHQHLDAINDNLSPAKKVGLMRALWEVACADGEIHHMEEHLIRRLADLMYVSHKDFIRSKHQALGT